MEQSLKAVISNLKLSDMIKLMVEGLRKPQTDVVNMDTFGYREHFLTDEHGNYLLSVHQEAIPAPQPICHGCAAANALLNLIRNDPERVKNFRQKISDGEGRAEVLGITIALLSDIECFINSVRLSPQRASSWSIPHLGDTEPTRKIIGIAIGKTLFQTSHLLPLLNAEYTEDNLLAYSLLADNLAKLGL